MKFVPAFNALSTITKTPSVRARLAAANPDVLQQAEDALKSTAPGTDPVAVASALLVERLENIIPNLGIGTAAVTVERCNGRDYVTVLFPVKTTKEAATAFCQFCKLWMHDSAALHEDQSGISVLFILDEDNA